MGATAPHLVARRQTPRLRGKDNRRGNLYAINADGGGKPERLTTSDSEQTPSSWASDQHDRVPAAAGLTAVPTGIWVLPMEGEPQGRRLFLESRFNLSYPEFSPDGRWMAYVSNESGAAEVYVQPYPGPGEKIRISTAGGLEPIWTANGRELLYRASPVRPAGFSPRRSAPCLRFGPTRLACCSRPRPVSTIDDAGPKLGCQRRRPAVPPAAARRINGQAGHRDARRAELGRRVEAPRPGEVAVSPG